MCPTSSEIESLVWFDIHVELLVWDLHVLDQFGDNVLFVMVRQCVFRILCTGMINSVNLYVR